MIRDLEPLQASTVQDFLGSPKRAHNRAKRRTDQTILIGPKGNGKTLLLGLRSKILRDNVTKDSPTVFFPKDKLFERFRNSDAIREDVWQRPDYWRNPDHWCSAWKHALTIVVFELAEHWKHLNDKQLSFYRAYVDPMHTYNEQNIVIRSRTPIDYLRQVVFLSNDLELYKQFNRFMEQEIHSYILADQNTTYNLFLDAPDEAFPRSSYQDPSLSDVPKRTTEKTHISSHFTLQAADDQSYWLELQMGLLLAARQIKELSNLIRVYATIKTEIYSLDKRSELFEQSLDLCLPLDYSPQQLEAIFRINCEKSLSAIRNCSVDNEDAIQTYLQFDVIEHDDIIDKNDEILCERPFDYLLRHSLYRPRNLMAFGSAIEFLITSNNLSVHTFREKVNEESEKLFQHLREQSSPAWEPRYMKVLNHIGCNIFSRQVLLFAKQEFKNWTNKHAPSLEKRCPFQYLYLHGLLGFIDARGLQSFRTDWTSPAKHSVPITDSDYYFLHPMLSGYMKNERSSDAIPFRKSRRTISGHGCHYQPEIRFKVIQITTNQYKILFNDVHELFDKKSSKPKNLLLTLLHAFKEFKTDMLSIDQINHSANTLQSEKFIRSSADIKSSIDKLMLNQHHESSRINSALAPYLRSSVLSKNGDCLRLQGLNAIDIQFSRTELSLEA